MLGEALRVVERRYRLPPIADASGPTHSAGAAAAVALAIENARQEVEQGGSPDPSLKRFFIDALARMIHEAMQGDPAFQAMVLRHSRAQVREYATLSTQAEQDRRRIHAIVNGIAHPGKQRQTPPGRLREAMEELHALASCASWSALHATARRLLDVPRMANESAFAGGLTELVDHAGLRRLLRLEILASDELIQQYEALWQQHGPRSGSLMAIEQGSASQRRGAAVEARAAQALDALARALNERGSGRGPYRAVTSMRVPASIPSSHERAKSEWDVVLLRQAKMADADPAWDVCLLVEAKASVDAATTDLPRLLRGLRLLAHAEQIVYQFQTRQGTIRIRGASLSSLRIDDASLAESVLYFCDEPADAASRLLSAASRMQLLSAQASLDFASALAEGRHADRRDLEPLWNDLTESAEWKGVLHQYPMLRRVRELMVHADDLWVAINRMEGAKTT